MARKILIIDDSGVDRQLLSAILGTEYDVIEAENGSEAIDALTREGNTVSAIVLDILMPVMDGYEVLRRIGENPVWNRVPTIVATALADEGAQERAIALGASGFICKPYNKTLLLNTLRNYIHLREAASALNAMRLDDLTGLYNRKAFFEEAEKMISAREPGYYILSCFDIENFKIINDQYGTDIGDRVLCYVAKCVSRCADDTGGICCRHTSDQFAMLYPAADKDAEAISKLHTAVTMPDCINRTIRLRVGRYLVTEPSLPVSSMFDRATLAEESIRGRYDTNISDFHETMRKHLLHEQQIVNEMHGALEAGQFEPWFQPQYNHATGALVGAEALVRWRHPEKGLIPPDEFIPVFERNGFIYELDKYIWERVCILLRRWLDEKREPLPVSVNISRYDVFTADFMDVITGLVKKYAIPIDLLRLEITESAFAKDAKQIVTIIKRLIDFGFTVEIDDFGSGYSSLNTLKDVPAQILKLDMKFLEDGSDSQRSGSIIESVVRMAKWLDMSVIAEGVEKKTQADYLLSVGCNYIQGYFYSMALPVDEYERLAATMAKEPKMSGLETVENLDNHTFWDPESMDTLVFNSYVGGASIVEFHNGKYELIRSNNRFKSEFGGYVIGGVPVYEFSPDQTLDEKNLRIMGAAAAAAIKTGREATCEFEITGFDGAPGETLYLRWTVRPIAKAGDRYLLYTIIINISEVRLAEKKERLVSERARVIMDSASCGITAVVMSPDGTADYVFVNDRYYSMLGYTREQFMEASPKGLELLHPDDLAKYGDEICHFDTVGQTMTCEFRARRRDGSWVWLHDNITVVRLDDVEGPVQLSCFTDISPRKESERQLSFLNSVAGRLLSQPDVGVCINDTLSMVMDYFSGKRAYVFEFDGKSETTSNTYEICAGGVAPEKDNLQNVPLRLLSFWMHAFDSQKYLSISDVGALGGGRDEEREILAAQGIHSLIAAPLLRDGEYIGFIGIDDAEYQDTQIAHLAALGDYMTVLLTRRDLLAQVRAESQSAIAIMNGIPGGFIRARVKPDGALVPLYFSEGFRKLMGMNEQMLTEHFIKNFYRGIHPEDVEAVRDAIEKMERDGEAHNVKFRLFHSGGDYIRVMMVGKMRVSDSGETYLNVYFSDTTEQEKAEEMQISLLDNLPCGAALYDFDGRDLKIIHRNRHYWELVNRSPEGQSGASFPESVYPEDRAIIMQEVFSAVRQRRDLSADVRILCGGNEYHPFHISGRLVAKAGGHYTVYAAYTPIADDIMSIQKMLPVALSTVINASSDFTFIKDADLRYISCSQSALEFFGFDSANGIAGKSDYDLFEKEVADEYVADDRRLLESGKAVIDEQAALVSHTGKLRYSNVSKYPIRDIGGRIIGVYCVSRDITELHGANFELDTLLNAIPSGVLKYSADEKEEFAYVSRSFIESLGYTEEQFKEKFHNCFHEMVYAGDRDRVENEVLLQEADGGIGKFDYRIETFDGRLRWFHDEGKKISDKDGREWYYVTLVDITEQKETEQRLRLSEEEYRLAAQHRGTVIARYTVADRALVISSLDEKAPDMPDVMHDIPDSSIRLGIVSHDTQAAYRAFYESILSGESEGSAKFLRKLDGSWKWIEARFTTLFSDDGKPVSAVISFNDVSEQSEKDAIYRKWEQSMRDRPDDSYTLLRCNLNKNGAVDSVEGSLLRLADDVAPEVLSGRSREFSEQYIYDEDKEKYLSLVNPDILLAAYYRGRRTDALEYRENLPEGGFRWLRLTVELVQYPNSTDIEAYMLYENIDESKRAELLTIMQAETDPLTGILNRKTFEEKFNKMSSQMKKGRYGALLMIDLDGFKLVNDSFGHAIGDQTLIEIGQKLKSVLRSNDLVCRLGGDEFMVCLCDLPDREIIGRKAKHICALLHRSFSLEVHLSASMGVAVFPDDGGDFDTLYHKSDIALYHVKATGKNSYAFYSGEMTGDCAPHENAPLPRASGRLTAASPAHRMLIVEDSRLDCDILANMFKDEFIIDTAENGEAALELLRCYGAGISVVLLDLVMPEMDGFAVLEKMRDSAEMQSVPVIVVSGVDEREASLRAIKTGASDFVTKPVDRDLLRIRVQSAVSKAENERLRAQNRYLALQNSEVGRYRAVLEDEKTVLVEYDVANGTFMYDDGVALYIDGSFDGRPLWDILLLDKVAKADDVERLKKLVADTLEGAGRSQDMEIGLKTPADGVHLFRVKAIRRIDEFHLGGKLVLMFADMG